MATEPKAAVDDEGLTAKFEVMKPFKHAGKDRAPGENVMLTEDMATHLVSLGMVKVALKAN